VVSASLIPVAVVPVVAEGKTEMEVEKELELERLAATTLQEVPVERVAAAVVA
jgi:hypothetical protein